MQSNDRCYRNSKRIGSDRIIITYQGNTYIIKKTALSQESVKRQSFGITGWICSSCPIPALH